MLGYNMQLKIPPNSENKYKVLQCNKEDVIILITFVGLLLDVRRFYSNASYAAKAKFTNFSPLTATWNHTAAWQQPDSGNHSL